MLEPFDLSSKLILADKGYDSDKVVHWIKGRGRIAVIPVESIPERLIGTYIKNVILIESLFLKLKNHRRFSTRYEKMPLCFHAVFHLLVS